MEWKLDYLDDGVVWMGLLESREIGNEGFGGTFILKKLAL